VLQTTEGLSAVDGERLIAWPPTQVELSATRRMTTRNERSRIGHSWSHTRQCMPTKPFGIWITGRGAGTPHRPHVLGRFAEAAEAVRFGNGRTAIAVAAGARPAGQP
jgi:hypothetical protein